MIIHIHAITPTTQILECLAHMIDFIWGDSSWYRKSISFNRSYGTVSGEGVIYGTRLDFGNGTQTYIKVNTDNARPPATAPTTSVDSGSSHIPTTDNASNARDLEKSRFCQK